MKKRSDSAAARQASRLRQQGARRTDPAAIVDADHEVPSLVLEGHDQASLASAKTQWFFGDWNALAGLDLEALLGHPDRDRFALLVASAHQQLGNHDTARRFTRQAMDWGCPPKLVARILIAGVHNTLGRVSALKQDERRIALHFRAAVASADSDETTLATHARSVRELTRLGLLPQAASMLAKELRETAVPTQRPQLQRARLKMLETEVELLRHALTLAQQRQQLFRGPGDGEPGGGEVGSAHWLAELKTRSLSQLGQDLWVLERTGYKRGGFFVEFGATDGVTLSNTWLLEKEFGWRGICAEPNPKFFKELRQNRSCMLSSACIGSGTGEEVEFVMAAEYGGMRRHASLDNNADRRSGYLADEARTVRLRTVSLNDFLKDLGAPRHIDYLSVDTEGSEFEILATFPFSEWQVDLLTVEHNFTPEREQIRDLLKANGYSRIEAEWDDWYYRNNMCGQGSGGTTS